MLARTVHTLTDGSTTSLLLRTFSPSDAQTFRAYRADADTARFQSWDPHTYEGDRGLAAAAKFCGQHHLFGAHVFGRIDYTALRGRWIQLALEDGAGHVGDVGVLVGPDGRQATLGVTLAPSARGKGYARAGLRMTLDWLFAAVPVADPRQRAKGKGKETDDGEKEKEEEEADVGAEDGVYVPGVAVHRASAMVDARNERSAHLLDALGFRKEAHHVQSSFYKNEWCDDDVWATLRTEWIDRKYPSQ
ncbi:acyl-CoA N-acyltransferase [Auricularia subglabra TFB-10046 SS5]|nr:acyl-CoA N-acyltransferase [Auricularia subglabra TFB-10046 SS5]